MAHYFRYVPNFAYVNRDTDSQGISDYKAVKNIFKRGKIREDIFGDLQFFEKYQIVGDERPDNVAFKLYDDETLDWVVLLSNNIVNIQSEWPLPQSTFDEIMLEKYGSYENLYSAIHHYETTEIRNSNGVIVLSSGLKINPTWETNGNFVKEGNSYYYEYFDSRLDTVVQIPSTSFIVGITNFEYESQLENDKRNIYILKPLYLNVVFNDMDDIMPYKKGSRQFVTETLKRGDNIRLFN